MKYYKLGSNQYLKKPKHNAMKYLYWYIFLVGLLFMIPHFLKPLPTTKVQAQVRPVVKITPTLTPTPKPTTEQELIVAEIKEVFGVHSDRAFKLLECENRSLNPKAMNDNYKLGGVGKDWGVFQINDHWQGVTNVSFLTDWKINIRMAWNIFERDNYSFKLWTCGRGI